MNEEVATVVTQFLDIETLGRFARTCKSFRAVVETNELAWQSAFERMIGQSVTTTTKTKIPREWEPIGWRERTKALVESKGKFEKMERKSGQVFGFGEWRIVNLGDIATTTTTTTTAAATEDAEGTRKEDGKGGEPGDTLEQQPNTSWITTEDGGTVIEIPWTTNGWSRMRDEGGKEWVLWSRVMKEPQELEDKPLKAFVAQQQRQRQRQRGEWLEGVEAIPLCSGTKWEHGSREKENPTSLWMEVTSEQLIVHLPGYPGRGPNDIFLARAGAGESFFHTCPLTRIPVSGGPH